MLQRISTWLAAIPIDDPIDRRQAISLQIMLVALMVFGVLVFPFSASTDGELARAGSVAGNLMWLLNAGIGLALVRRSFYRAAVVAAIAAVTSGLLFNLLVSGFTQTRGILVLFALPLALASLLIGRRALVLTTVAIILVITTVAILEQLDPPLAGFIPGTRNITVIVVALMLSLLLVAVFLEQFAAALREALIQARLANERLLAEIAERRSIEAALRESEAALRMAYEAADIGVWRHDIIAGRFTYDERARRHYGVLAGPDTGEEALARIHREDRERVVRDIEISHDPSGSGRAIHEYRVVHADGSVHWLAVQAQVYFSGEGKDRRPLFAVGTSQDVTDRRQLETQLIQARKLEGIGRLAGGVAHDFNNLLVAIGGYTELALDTLPPDSVARADLDEVRKATGRAANLTRQLLAFARRQITDPHPLDLGALVADMESLVRRLIREDIELTIVGTENLWPVRIDPSQVEQLVVNLVVNARDAMPDGGRLVIETDNTMLDEGYARQHIAVLPGPYVLLAVSDTGVGMSEEVQRHLFEPFFTTKEPGMGTGMGLATCYGIVKQNGGFIWVYSELGQGTTVRIYLPRVAGAARAFVRVTASDVVPRGDETLLLVEDELAVRELAARVLRELGYTVIAAADGREALALAADDPQRIALLVTDVIMPHVGGRALAEALTQRHPALKVLYISGYTDNAITHHGRLEPGTALLEKPFTTTALARKVREMLDV